MFFKPVLIYFVCLFALTTVHAQSANDMMYVMKSAASIFWSPVADTDSMMLYPSTATSMAATKTGTKKEMAKSEINVDLNFSRTIQLCRYNIICFSDFATDLPTVKKRGCKLLSFNINLNAAEVGDAYPSVYLYTSPVGNNACRGGIPVTGTPCFELKADSTETSRGVDEFTFKNAR